MYKDPITDAGKKSKKGQMTLEVKDGHFVTMTGGAGDPKNVSDNFKYVIWLVVIY